MVATVLVTGDGRLLFRDDNSGLAIQEAVYRVTADFLINPDPGTEPDQVIINDFNIPMVTGTPFNQTEYGPVGVTGNYSAGVQFNADPVTWPEGKRVVVTMTLQYFKGGVLVHTDTGVPIELSAQVYEARYLWPSLFSAERPGMVVTITAVEFLDLL